MTAMICGTCGLPLVDVAETRQRDGYIMRMRRCEDGHRTETWEIPATIARRSIIQAQKVLSQYQNGVAIRQKKQSKIELLLHLRETMPDASKYKLSKLSGISQRHTERILKEASDGS